MSSRRLTIVLCAAAVALSACGGGNGSGMRSLNNGSGAGGLTILDKWQRYTAGNPTLNMTGAQVSVAWRAATRRSTSNVIIGGEGGMAPASPEEGGSSSNVPQFPVEIDPCGPGDCDVESLPHNTFTWAPVLRHNDVPVATVSGRLTNVDEPDPDDPFDDDAETYLTDFRSYGGWLEHTEFRVSYSRWCEVGAAGCSGRNPIYEEGSIRGSMAGAQSRTTPTGTGSATWAGVMVGMESPEAGTAAALALLRNAPDVYLGDARIMIDNLAAPDIDVSFTNIHNVSKGTSRSDITWEGLPVENGLFGDDDSDSGEYIAGMFTGPRHQEAGGHFRRGGIVGAFGAKRQ